MSRAATKSAQNQLSTTNQIGASAGSKAQSEFGPLTEQANALINSPGYDPATLSAITNAGMGANNAAFGSAAGDINRTAARTKNPGSVAPNLDALAMERGKSGGDIASGIQEQNANYQQQQRTQGINLLNSMYGQNTGAEESFYGQAPGLINAQTNASPGWAQTFKDVASGIGGLVHGPKG